MQLTSTGTLSATAFSGPLTGDVTGNVSGSAGSATGNAATATLATTVTITDNAETDETVYPVFVDGATGTQGLETETKLSYKPDTGILTSIGFAGALTGDVTGNVSGTAATVTGAAQSNITSLGTLTALTGGTGDLIWDTNTLVVDSSANRVGIGTTSPGGKLHVDDGVVRAASLTFGAAASTIIQSENSELAFGLSNASPWNYWMQARTHTDGARGIVINPLGGNVGIGALDADDYTLHVKGTFQAQGDHDGNVIINNTGTDQVILASHTGSGTPVPWDIREDSSTDNNGANYGALTITRMNMTADGAGSNIHFRAKRYDSSTPQEIGGIGATIDTGLTASAEVTGSLHFYTTTATATLRQEKMTIKSSGNVGIGTTNPTFASGSGLHITNSTQANVRLEDDAGEFFDLAMQQGDVYLINRVADGFLSLRTNSTERMRILANGDIGMNQASPAALLHLKGSENSWDKHIRLEDHDTTNYGAIIYDSGGMKFRTFEASDSFFWRNDSNTTNMILTDAGELGIGTSSPTGTLTVTSSGHDMIHLNRTVDNEGYGAGIIGRLGNDASTTAAHEYAAIFFQIEDHTDGAEKGAISFNVSTGGTAADQSSTHAMQITSDGHVGIGTTAPIMGLADSIQLNVHNPTTKKKRKISSINNEINTDFLEKILLDFGVEGKIKKVSRGQVVTLNELEPAAGIKVSKIINLSEDIARNTSSESARISTIPGRNTIGIELPN